jgi:ethanolamine utilization protein EutN
MELGKVVGTVVCTQKNIKLEGQKLLVVEAVAVDGVPKKSFTVALDNVGAGLGEMVLMVKGSSARQAKGMETTPTDATIVGIVDTVEMGGNVTFKKY